MSRRLTINIVPYSQLDFGRLGDYYFIDSSIEHMELKKVSSISIPDVPNANRRWAEGRVFYEIKEE